MNARNSFKIIIIKDRIYSILKINYLENQD